MSLSITYRLGVAKLIGKGDDQAQRQGLARHSSLAKREQRKQR